MHPLWNRDPNAYRKWYHLQRWERRARAQKRMQPLCEMCLAKGTVKAATTADPIAEAVSAYTRKAFPAHTGNPFDQSSKRGRDGSGILIRSRSKGRSGGTIYVPIQHYSRRKLSELAQAASNYPSEGVCVLSFGTMTFG